jgi:transcriptional regulator GlxA family with amidase domain
MTTLRLHVLVLRDCTAFVSIGFADLFRKADALAASLPARRERPRLEIVTVSPTKKRLVAGAGGVRVHCDALMRDVKKSDLILVPALDPDVEQHLALNRDAVPWLRKMFAAGADVATACTGAFLVAEAGLLDRKAATTHWAFQGLFQRRYPKTRLEPQAIVVDQGRVVTAGGATSFLSLALYLVERLLGPEVARASSKMFLIDVNKAPQSSYAMFGTQKAHSDDEILRAQSIIESEIADAPSVEDIAHRVAMSKRNFVRRFKSATGNVPRDYIQRVRVEAAKRAFESGRQSVATVARRVGYEDVVAFRKVFLRWTGLAPADYRARYGPRTAPTLVAR